MPTQPHLLLLQKTMVMVEGVAARLDPHVNTWELAEPYVRQWMRQELGPEARLADAFTHAVKLIGELRWRSAARASRARCGGRSANRIGCNVGPLRFSCRARGSVCMIDRPYLFAHLRPMLGGILSQAQIDGVGHLLDAWEREYAQTDRRWLSYILATVEHETARTFQPVEEWGHGRERPYGTIYYGRGYCQLTWKVNYARFGRLLGVDLVGHPERVLEPDIAATILFRGMVEGLYTGRKLADFIVGERCDYLNARRVVNSLDRASHIADLALGYSRALRDRAEAQACAAAPSSSSSRAA